MAKRNSLVSLAKGTTKKPATQAKKPVAKVEKPRTLEEERDMKAKQKVEELLQSVELSPNKLIKDDVSEVVVEKKNGIEWMEEQVTLLTEQSEALRIELAQAKDDYARIYDKLYNTKDSGSNNMVNETVVQNVLLIFNELQSNLLGNNQERTIWKTVEIRYLLNQMLQLFPFTERHKRF